jgi:protein O-GlcNAc transferase
MKTRTKRGRPNTPPDTAEQACVLAGDQQFAQAAACLRRVLGEQSGPRVDNPIHDCMALLVRLAGERPDWSSGHYALGCVYERLGEYEQARAHLARTLELDNSHDAPAHAILARMLWAEKKWTEALAETDRALAANPGNMLANIVRGRCFSALGRMNESIACNRRALAVQPKREVHSFLLFEMNFAAETTPEALYEEACRWNELYAAPLAARIRPHPNTRDPERRLRVGYVSPDLYHHAIMKYLPGVLEHHDRSQVEIFLYDVGGKPDDHTENVRRVADTYRTLPDVGGEALAEQVRSDAIDILIDLAGHTMGSPYLAFAEKPAPVQVSWLGALSTTGMRTMDYFLGDAHMPCPGTEHLFSEEVYRLPRLSCSYRPFERVPVAPSPCLRRGFVTFGCFHSPRKLTRPVIGLWSTILHLLPDSRLLLKFRGMETGLLQDYFRGQFVEDGIAPERLLFAGPSPAREYLEAYREIDVALDPFPYNGGSTNVDTVWMGVPLVTLAGRLPVQRAGTALLNAIGMPDLVAHSPEQYVNIALYLAGAVQKLPALRNHLRQAVAESPLMDDPGMARALDEAYRDMWRRWCSGRPA